LLIDADLRSSRQHEVFSTSGATGLADALLQPRIPESAVAATDIAHLDLMPSGGDFGVPQAILNALNFGRVLAELRGRYEAIVLDSPPLEHPETAVLAATANQTVFVLDPELTDRATAQGAVEQLHRDGGTVVGVVVSCARLDV
jgi:Mrp family chromosome partitioning ATPase